MTRATTAWEIAPGSSVPKVLVDSTIDLEKELESWVASNPGMLEPGLVVLARQLETDGGPLDLLCLDDEGALVVVELKRDEVYRVTLSQVLDYAACIAAMTYEHLESKVNESRTKWGYSPQGLADVLEKALGSDWTLDPSNVRVLVAGTGADSSLRRIIDFLSSRFGVPANGVFFDVFSTSVPSKILVRSAVVEDEQALKQGGRRGRGGVTDDDLLATAEANGLKDVVLEVLEGWTKATGRAGRAERNGFWSLPAKRHGTKVAARLYPGSDDGTRNAWLAVSPEKIAADAGTDLHVVRTTLSGTGLKQGVHRLGQQFAVPNAAAANAVSAAIMTLYSKAPAILALGSGTISAPVNGA